MKRDFGLHPKDYFSLSTTDLEFKVKTLLDVHHTLGGDTQVAGHGSATAGKGQPKTPPTNTQTTKLWSQLEKTDKAGVCIGCHGTDHCLDGCRGCAKGGYMIVWDPEAAKHHFDELSEQHRMRPTNTSALI